MSIEGTQEIHPSEIDNQAEPRPHRNPWLRVIIYLVIVGAGSTSDGAFTRTSRRLWRRARSRQRHC